MARWDGPAAENEVFERFTEVVDRVLGVAARSREAWQLEEVACAIVPPYIASSVSDTLLDQMVGEIAQRPGGVSVLHVMGKLAMPLLAIRAHAAAETATQSGQPGPSALARRCGTLTPSGAWVVEQHGHVVTIFLSMERPRLTRLQAAGFVLLTPELDGGISDGLLREPMSEGRLRSDIVSRFSGEPNVRVREAPTGEAIELILAACQRNLDVGLAPSDDGIGILNVVLASAGVDVRQELVTALGRLPSFEPPWGTSDQAFEFVDMPPLTDEQEAQITGGVEKLVAAFNEQVASRERDHDQRELAEFLARLTIEYQAWQRDGEPWSGTMLRDFLLAYLPHKARFEPEDIDRVPAVLGQVMQFLGEQDDRLGRADASAFAALAERLAPAFAAEVGNPRNKGPAARIGEAMAASGVDLADQGAVQAWLRDFNERPLEERKQLLPDEAFPGLPTPVPEQARPESGASKRRRQAARSSRKANRRRR